MTTPTWWKMIFAGIALVAGLAAAQSCRAGSLSAVGENSAVIQSELAKLVASIPQDGNPNDQRTFNLIVAARNLDFGRQGLAGNAKTLVFLDTAARSQAKDPEALLRYQRAMLQAVRAFGHNAQMLKKQLGQLGDGYPTGDLQSRLDRLLDDLGNLGTEVESSSWPS